MSSKLIKFRDILIIWGAVLLLILLFSCWTPATAPPVEPFAQFGF